MSNDSPETSEKATSVFDGTAIHREYHVREGNSIWKQFSDFSDLSNNVADKPNAANPDCCATAKWEQATDLPLSSCQALEIVSRADTVTS